MVSREFTHYDLFDNPTWEGHTSYKQMLLDPNLARSMQVTLLYVVVSGPAVLVLSLGLAMLVDRGVRALAK